jgi:hypothetical protein
MKYGTREVSSPKHQSRFLQNLWKTAHFGPTVVLPVASEAYRGWRRLRSAAKLPSATSDSQMRDSDETNIIGKVEGVGGSLKGNRCALHLV